MPQGGRDAYQTLPDHTLAERKWMVVLVWSTIAYQSLDLGLNLPCVTFTNHYHRGQGQGTDLGVEGSVAGWASVVATWAVW